MKPFEVEQKAVGYCEGHSIGGRQAVYVVRFRSGTQVGLCEECACDLGDALPDRPQKAPPRALKTGDGEGPDFRPLPVTPTRVQP